MSIKNKARAFDDFVINVSKIIINLHDITINEYKIIIKITN